MFTKMLTVVISGNNVLDNFFFAFSFYIFLYYFNFIKWAYISFIVWAGKRENKFHSGKKQCPLWYRWPYSSPRLCRTPDLFACSFSIPPSKKPGYHPDLNPHSSRHSLTCSSLWHHRGWLAANLRPTKSPGGQEKLTSHPLCSPALEEPL